MKQLIVPSKLIVGEYYSNDQIIYSLGVGNSGGIRPKLDTNRQLDYIVLITSTEESKLLTRNPYADRIEGDVLIYTGAGLKGEQEIVGGNKRLLEQIDSPVPILGFTKEDTNRYKFIGYLFLLRYYNDYQLDSSGSMRKVWMFEFKIVLDLKNALVNKLGDVFLPAYTNLKREIVIGDTKVIEIDEQSVGNNKFMDIKGIEILKNNLMMVDPYKFEVVASKLISHVGFSDVVVTKKSGDGGIDVNAILKNPVSTDLKFSFQIKRWKHSVGRNEVANLRGSMGLNNQGVIIATSYFTESAVSEARSENKTPINLVGISDLYNIIHMTDFDINKHLS